MKRMRSFAFRCIASATMLAVAGCFASPKNNTITTTTQSASSALLYVNQNDTTLNSGPPEILAYATSANGTPSPVSSISLIGSATSIGFIATDAAGDIYACSSSTSANTPPAPAAPLRRPGSSPSAP